MKAAFGPDIPRTPDTMQTYAAFISGQVRLHGLKPFASDAVARVLEYGSRLAEDQGHLATRFDAIADLLTEAGCVAHRLSSPRVIAEHVDAALVAREHPLNLAEDAMQRMIEEGTILIDTHRAAVGQVNGLSVLDVGDYAFGRPSRITARVGIGEEGIVDIEREIKLSGPTHSKGVLTLTGYLLGMYAQEHRLALSARLTFEQVYGGVEGDSASSAELYALLSSLAELPIRQGIAVTGSVNQFGEGQAVGGDTAKVGGFYTVCKAQGLDGHQGVIIPASNARHLVVKPEIADAVAAGRFHVWTVHKVDEGIELLTNVPAGTRRSDGSYPVASVHGRVQRRLHSLAERLREHARLAPRSPARRNGAR